MREQLTELQDKVVKRDDTITALTAALNAKTEHRQVQMTAGGEVMQLVSEADLKELAARVAACEKTTADQGAKLDMNIDMTMSVRKELRDGRAAAGAPPAVPSSVAPPLPPRRPVATPGRRLESSSNGELHYCGWAVNTEGISPYDFSGGTAGFPAPAGT